MRNADLGALPAVHLFRLMESWHNPVQRLPNAGGIILLQGLLENLQLLSQLTGSNRRLPLNKDLAVLRLLNVRSAAPTAQLPELT